VKNDYVAASVLSGNRNFEARVHQNIKANFLMSPPLVVAFALAGRVDIDLSCEPFGSDFSGNPFISPTSGRRLQEVRDAMESALKPEVFRKLYKDFAAQNPKWNEIPSSTATCTSGIGNRPTSRAAVLRELRADARQHRPDHRRAPLGIFGDSVTTDHISPCRRDQEEFARWQIPHRQRRQPGTSTATARVAAMTAS
jgi:aconitate hydratase